MEISISSYYFPPLVGPCQQLPHRLPLRRVDALYLGLREGLPADRACERGAGADGLLAAVQAADDGAAQRAEERVVPLQEG